MSLKYILHARVFRNSEALCILLLDICKDLSPFLPIPRTDPGPFILSSGTIRKPYCTPCLGAPMKYLALAVLNTSTQHMKMEFMLGRNKPI